MIHEPSASNLTRRAFTRASASAFAATLGAAAMPQIAAAASTRQRPLCAFVKFLTMLNYDELAASIKELGFDGVEVTVRRESGYINPSDAARELPKFRKSLDKHRLELSIVTTDLLDVDQPHARAVLQASADAGAKRYRLGFYRYDSARPIVEQIEAIRPKLARFAEASRKLSLPGMYQNHSGKEFFGATLWDLFYALRDISPEELGCVYDLRHAMVEAGEAWPMLYDVIKPHVIGYSVKDFDWGAHRSRHVPLGEGRVERSFYERLARTGFQGPVSLHVEYLPKGTAADQLAALKRDYSTLRKWIRG